MFGLLACVFNHIGIVFFFVIFAGFFDTANTRCLKWVVKMKDLNLSFWIFGCRKATAQTLKWSRLNTHRRSSK